MWVIKMHGEGAQPIASVSMLLTSEGVDVPLLGGRTHNVDVVVRSSEWGVVSNSGEDVSVPNRFERYAMMARDRAEARQQRASPAVAAAAMAWRHGS